MIYISGRMLSLWELIKGSFILLLSSLFLISVYIVAEYVFDDEMVIQYILFVLFTGLIFVYLIQKIFNGYSSMFLQRYLSLKNIFRGKSGTVMSFNVYKFNSENKRYENLTGDDSLDSFGAALENIPLKAEETFEEYFKRIMQIIKANGKSKQYYG